LIEFNMVENPFIELLPKHKSMAVDPVLRHFLVLVNFLD